MSSAQHPFKQSSFPSKGIGLTATQSIPAGTLIISERPILTLSHSQTAENVAASLRSLPKEHQRAFLSLHNNFCSGAKSLPPLIGIFKTNAISLGTSASNGGIFPTISRFNHSCEPNAMYSWNGPKGVENVYAIKEIKDGEEITVSYLGDEGIMLPKAGRQEQLRGQFNFICACEFCKLPTTSPEETRRVEISKLDSLIGSGTLIITNPSKALGICKKIIDMWKQEGILDPRLCRAYCDAFQMCTCHSDFARAAAFLRENIAVKEFCQGVDFDDSEGLRELMEKPETHRLSGMSGKWRTKRKDMKDRESEGFEGWLWSRAG